MFLWVLEKLYPESEIDEAPHVKLQARDYERTLNSTRDNVTDIER